MSNRNLSPAPVGAGARAFFVAGGLLVFNAVVVWLFLNILPEDTFREETRNESLNGVLSAVALGVVIVEVALALRAAWPRNGSRDGTGLLISLLLLPIACLPPFAVLLFVLTAHST